MKKSTLIPCMDWIINDDNEKLHQSCQEVSFPLSAEDHACVEKMIAYIDACFKGDAAKLGIIPGIGIAAPQLGHFKQMFYINFVDRDAVHHQLLLANPRSIVESAHDAYLSDGEGCLSVRDDHNGYSRRKAWIIVEGYDLKKQEKIQFKASGLFGICVQHELDHLNGLLYYDRINKLNPFLKLDTDEIY